jgi:hypothetical protein
MESQELEPKTTETEEVLLFHGNVIDPETGEVIATIAEDAKADEDFANDLVRQINFAEARKSGATFALANAMQACENSLRPEINRYTRLVEYLRSIYTPWLKAFASKNLPKGKKTVKTAYGSLSFKTVPGSWKVVDRAKLAALLEEKAMSDRMRIVGYTIDFEGLPTTEREDAIRVIAMLPEAVGTIADFEFDVDGLPEPVFRAAVESGAIFEKPESETFTVKISTRGAEE